MNLADKIKQAYFGGNQADLSKEVSATDVKSVAQVLAANWQILKTHCLRQ